MGIPEVFYMTPAYFSKPGQADADKAQLQLDAWSCYDMAHQGNMKAAQDIMLAWALGCRNVGNHEGQLVMTYKGQLFLESYLMMHPDTWNSGVFRPWVETVYRPCAQALYHEQNNLGAWGILGCVLADMILEGDRFKHTDRIAKYIDQAVGDGGKMVYEVERTYSFLWYSYFALAPLFRACQLSAYNNIGDLRRPLSWLFQYCLKPNPWPYKPGIFSRLLHPCASAPEYPKANDWTGSLFMAAGRFFQVPEWQAWATPWPNKPPFPGCNIFRWAD